PMALMLLASVVLALVSRMRMGTDNPHAPALRLSSPFSLGSALRFGLIFLILEVAGTVAQRLLGDLGFYAVSLVGGLVSSASAVASAASLVTHGVASPSVAGTGAVLASIASAAVNLPLIARISGHRGLTVRLAISMAIVIALGFLGLALQQVVPPLPIDRR
ncbi:MAG: hypothetical protein K0R41_3553, partial [Geminicoccaceae bacterium]|nr:hypothetical protein [Geminicoccaceae bacterium]